MPSGGRFLAMREQNRPANLPACRHALWGGCYSLKGVAGMSPINLVLEPQYEHQWMGENPSPATFNSEQGHFPLYHQWRTYKATEPIIVNTYNTGTGKTKAALLRLLKRAREIGFNSLDSSEHNALLIAPTNELLAQHARDATEFCDKNDIPYRVVSISRPD